MLIQSNNPYKSIEQETEHLVGRTRKQIQEIRNQSPNRHVILAGFGAGAAIALQVAIVEPVNSIVCLSFAFNTLNGVRGCSDDRILEITTPIIFIIGQNAQRSRYFIQNEWKFSGYFLNYLNLICKNYFY